MMSGKGVRLENRANEILERLIEGEERARTNEFPEAADDLYGYC
jgi:hypothetical protein